MSRKKRHLIVNDFDNPPRNIKSLVGKECLLSDQNGCSAERRNKYQVVVWGPDAVQEPNFHFVDIETMGNTVNAAYSMLTGKFMDHGSVIKPLTNRQLAVAQRMLKKSWKAVTMQWWAFNEVKYPDGIKCPTLSNP